jgi:hypothetical protein
MVENNYYYDIMEYHRGEFCPLNGKICLEGYCCRCWVFETHPLVLLEKPASKLVWRNFVDDFGGD